MPFGKRGACAVKPLPHPSPEGEGEKWARESSRPCDKAYVAVPGGDMIVGVVGIVADRDTGHRRRLEAERFADRKSVV